MSERKKVLIVGAGLAGLGLYLALDKNKFDVNIVEKQLQKFFASSPLFAKSNVH